MMTKKILTGVDNSETALRAAEKAAALAAALGAELHVLSSYTVNMTEAVRISHPEAYEKVVSQYAENAERTASTVAEALHLGGAQLQISTTSGEGPPAAALLREADAIGADMIVVGNKRVQGFTRFLGSVARTIASEAHCDLYIVNTHQR